MDQMLNQHRDKIIRVGKLLFGFVVTWLILNAIALLIVLSSVVGMKVAGSTPEGANVLTELMSSLPTIPGLDGEEIQKITAWDLQSFLDHFWLIFTLALVSTIYFFVTMTLLLRIAGSLKQGELLSHRAIKSLNLLGWLYLVQGIVALVWGVIAQFVWTSNTCELLYFSFIHDVCNYTFAFSGSGIEWGMLALALSWIAQSFQEEQELIV